MDSLDYPALLLGAKGIVSGPSGIFPEPYIYLYQDLYIRIYKETKKQQIIINDFSKKVQGNIKFREGGNDFLLQESS